MISFLFTQKNPSKLEEKPKSMVPRLKGESLREPKASHLAPAVNAVLVPQVLETCPLHQRGPRELVITHARTCSHMPEWGGGSNIQGVVGTMTMPQKGPSSASVLCLVA